MKNMTEISESLSAQFRDLNGIHPGLWPIVPRMLCAVGSVIAVIAVVAVIADEVVGAAVGAVAVAAVAVA